MPPGEQSGVHYVKMALPGTTSLVKIMVFLAVCATTKGSQLEQQTGINDIRRGILNTLLQDYVSAFDELLQQPDYKDYAESMKTIKDLMIQSWIYTLVPDNDLLQKVMTVGDTEDLKTVKERIVQDLKEKDKKSSVSDAILKYVKTVKPLVKESFAKGVEKAKIEVDKVNDKWTKEKDRTKDEEYDDLYEKKQYHLRIAVFLHGFVNTATRMALQSYVLDFKDQEGRGHDTFQVQSSDGQMMELDTPPLNRDSFEELQEEKKSHRN